MSRQTKDWDVIVIGGGFSGIEAGVRAGSYGLKVLLIEKTALGGDHTSTAGIYAISLLRAASKGLKEKAFAEARHLVNRINESGAGEARLRQAGVSVRYGEPRFVAEDTIELDGERITASEFILCTGSSPYRPEIPGLEEAGFLTTRDILNLDKVPESVGIIGAGHSGVQIAQAFARLGSKVSLFEDCDRILSEDDLELSSWLTDRLRAEGISIYLDARVEGVRPGPTCHTIITRGFSGPSEECCEVIIATAGRVPNIHGLNLPSAGVEATGRGVVTTSRLHTTGPNVWACGGVRGGPHHPPAAEIDARRVVNSIFLPSTCSPDTEIAPWCCFTDPELAHLGITEEQAMDAGIDVDVYRARFDANDRALVEERSAGMFKVIASRRSGRLLGVHILGAGSSEMINEWSLAMHSGLTMKEIAATPHVYPSLGLSGRNAAREWCVERAARPRNRRAMAAYRTVREHRAPLAYSLAAVGVAAALLWTLKAVSEDADD